MYDAALDLKNLESFKDKEFRDSYISGRVRTSIALQMRAIREDLGLSQKDYAKKIGKPQSVVSRIENTAYGGVSIQTLLDVCEPLDIALVVKFASFDEFLHQHSDISRSTHAVESYDDTVFRITKTMQSKTPTPAHAFTEYSESDGSTAALTLTTEGDVVVGSVTTTKTTIKPTIRPTMPGMPLLLAV